MKIAIVGGGITGLTTAWALNQKGVEVTVFERHDEPGGSIRSISRDGWLLEYGPNTIQVRSKSVWNLIESLDLESQVCRPNASAERRYVVHGGELESLPGTLSQLFGSPLFSTADKWRLAFEPFRKRGGDPQESLSGFVRRRLGESFLEYAVNPFVGGIYAGDPTQLSVRYAFPRLYDLEHRYGSLLLGSVLGHRERRRSGRIPVKLISFRNGLQQLPLSLASGLDRINCGATVERVQQSGGRWVLTVNGRTSEPFDRVFLTIPLYHQSEQLIDGGGALLESADQLIYPPLSVIHTGYRKEQIEHPLDGFGFLVPEVERRSILGALFNSTLFGGRAPEGHVLLTTFVGGTRNRMLADKKSSELKRIVAREHEDLLGTRGEPVLFEHVYWPRAIPNYTTNYPMVEEAIQRVEEQNPGVYLGGNYRGGISLPDCMENGLIWADRLTE